jgi:hypothetical protein
MKLKRLLHIFRKTAPVGLGFAETWENNVISALPQSQQGFVLCRFTSFLAGGLANKWFTTETAFFPLTALPARQISRLGRFRVSRPIVSR